MNSQAKFLIYSFFVILPVFGFYACKQTPSDNNAENKFYYFPETNVYYDEAAGLFFYSLDSGKNWTSYPYSKANKHLISENKVEISVSKDEPVWRENDLHISTYNGTRLAILSTDTGRSKGEKVVLKQAVKTSSERKDSLKAATEARKPNFFQRIFGKKKKKN
ncbi:MAG: hypothetical protein ABIW38_01505 [Ferruginibacter sp.]